MDLYRAVRALYAYLPSPVIESLGRSRLLAPIRDRVLRPGGRSAVATREIAFEDVRFAYTAPFRALAKAEGQGIENSLCRLLRAGYEPGTVAVDVGANFGFVTCVLARSGATVVACECDAGVLPVLRENAARVGAEVRAARVGDGRGGTVRLDELVSGRVSVVKIDTDGSEPAVLSGADGILRRDRPLLVIESNGRALEMVEHLRGAGYTYFAGVKGEPPATAANLVAFTRPLAAPPRGAPR